MFTTKKKIILTLVVLVGFFSFYQKPKAEETWREKMQKLETTLSNLLPLVLSEKNFTNQKNKTKISENINTLVKLAHGLAKPMEAKELPPDSDPSLFLLLGTFEGDIRDAASSFQKGRLDYSRHLLKNVTAYCVTCHTRTNQGGEKFSAPKMPADLTAFEMAEYLTATRQFDPAVLQYEKIIKEDKEEAARLQTALQNALAITVRFKKDPAKTLALIETALKTKNLTDEVKQNIGFWKQSVLDWKKEPKNPVDIKAKIDQLLEKGKELQANGSYYAGLVEFLRVSSLAHSLLSQVSKPEETARALFQAGLAHFLLEERPVYFMPEMYFEACIKKAPHTSVATECYQVLEQSMEKTYSGSAGVVLPDDVKKQLQDLKKLSY